MRINTFFFNNITAEWFSFKTKIKGLSRTQEIFRRLILPVTPLTVLMGASIAFAIWAFIKVYNTGPFPFVLIGIAVGITQILIILYIIDRILAKNKAEQKLPSRKPKKQKVGGKLNIRGWIVLIFSILFAFVIWPWVNWTSYWHSIHLRERGKEGVGKVVDVRALKGDRVTYRYEVNGLQKESYTHIPSKVGIKIGDEVKIIYDSLDIETVKVVW
jgi:hypothetical protein